jgi:hypothetical protein
MWMLSILQLKLWAYQDCWILRYPLLYEEHRAGTSSRRKWMCGEYFVPDMVEKTVGSPTVAALSAGTLAQSYSSESWWPEVVEVL